VLAARCAPAQGAPPLHLQQESTGIDVMHDAGQADCDPTVESTKWLLSSTQAGEQAAGLTVSWLAATVQMHGKQAHLP
jgi:hypothetical protein